MAGFFGIGVGPGDPDLLTIKAIKTIRHLDILYTPMAKKSAPSFAMQIAYSYLPKNLMIKHRYFPMTNNLKEKQIQWHRITTEILTDVQGGKNVGFITLGDPAIYSTFSYLVNLLKNKILVKTIAGISSFSQMANKLSLPLILGKEFLGVISATASEKKINQAIDINDTLIIMKISLGLNKVFKLLKEKKLLKNALIIKNISLPNQDSIRLSKISPKENLPYFSTLLLKKSF